MSTTEFFGEFGRNHLPGVGNTAKKAANRNSIISSDILINHNYDGYLLSVFVSVAELHTVLAPQHWF
jgi:hypothetical protein